MNFRIRFLDMSSCKLTTLVGSDLPKLKNLETLILRGNDIGDIKRQTEVFQCLPSMSRLEIANNPMACEEDADLYLIALLPKLSILDCHSVTGPVRQKANEKCKMNNWIAKDVKEEDPMRDKLVDPVGLRTTAKPTKIVFQKRCSYRRKPISRRERLKPTQCELAAEQNARAAKSVLIKARMRFEKEFNERGRHSAPPTNYVDYQPDWLVDVGTHTTKSFQSQFEYANRQMNRSLGGPKGPKRAQGDHLKFMRWSELNNTEVHDTSVAPPDRREWNKIKRTGSVIPVEDYSIGTRVASRMGLQSRNELHGARGPLALGRTHSVIAPVNSVVSISLPKIGTNYLTKETPIRPITPLFATYNQKVSLKKFNINTEPLPVEELPVQPK